MIHNNKIVGIVSYSVTTFCGSGQPDVYTNVYDYLDWIKERFIGTSEGKNVVLNPKVEFYERGKLNIRKLIKWIQENKDCPKDEKQTLVVNKDGKKYKYKFNC